MPAGTTTLNTPWSRVANTTIRDFISGEQINILRNRKLTALMLKRGRITFNHAGTAMDFKVRYRRAPMVGFADGDTVTFSRQDRNKTAVVDWRGYSAADAMTKGEFLMNRSTEAIIKLFNNRTRDLLQDVEDQFCEQMYIDGSLAANSKSMHGLETYLGYANQAVGNGAMLPTATYGGLSCAPGAYGGSWSQAGALQWPNGKETDGSQSYDFWSPSIIDVGDTFFGTAANWGDANKPVNGTAVCIEALAYAIIKSKKSPSPKGELDLFLMNDNAYQQYVRNLRQFQRIVINGQISELIGMGFSDTVQQDGGKDVTWEYGLPTSGQTGNGIGVIGYGLNLDQLELCSMQAQVWVPEGPSFDDASKTWRWSIDFFGNLKSNPKYQCKLLNFTTPADSAQM
jgi:hypothetical protein